MSKIMLAVAASSMTVAPAMAAPANPASSLSVVKSVRAGAPTAKSDKLAGAGIFGAVIALGVAALVVLAVVDDSNDSDSN